MLHTKSKCHWPYDSGEEDFQRVFTIYGHGGYLGHVTRTFELTKFVPASLRSLYMKFDFNWPCQVSEDMFKNVDGRTDDRQTDAGVTGILQNCISSPMSLWLR